MSDKRNNDGALMPVASKRARQDNALANVSQTSAIIAAGPARSSSLLAPVMLLTGHEGEVFATKFSPDGKTVASAGFDKQIYLWNTDGECSNYAVMPGHSGAVLDLHWNPDGERIYTASTDKTCGVWDAETGERIRRLRGHGKIVNSCDASRNGAPMLASASDDCTVKVWDTRRRHHVQSFSSKFQLTAVAYSASGDQVYAAGLGCKIEVWDLRKEEVMYTLDGHTDTVTSLTTSPDGRHLLSNAMDNTVKEWDVQPFAAGSRLAKTFVGAQHNFEKNLIKCAWSKNGKQVACGSADRNVYVWDENTTRILYSLPGHKGSANSVDFHPNEPVIVSGGSDKKIYLGELHF